MFKHLLLAAIVAASFGGSMLGSVTPASAYLRYDFAMVSVNSVDMDDDEDDDFGWLSP